MKTKIALLALALGASTYLATAQDSPPPSDGQPPTQNDGGPGGRSGQHGANGHRGFHLLPPRAEQQLQLTDDQKKQVAALETETQAKLEKILTPDQMQKLKNMHPPMRQGGQGGSGGRGNNAGDDDNSMPPGPPPGDQ